MRVHVSSFAFSTAPWEAHSAEPVAFVVHGSTEAAGTVFDVYQVEPFTTDVEVVAEPEKVGTATVDENGDIVSDAGGRVYLGKDARLSRAHFRRQYPEWEAWKAVRDAWDPQGVFQSAMGQRLGLCGGSK